MPATSLSRLGFAGNIEYGPGRHGPGHALFVYLRDPDGHRIELFNTHYQVHGHRERGRCAGICRWRPSAAGSCRRGGNGTAEASRFAGVEPRDPAHRGDPMNLEKFIAAGMR